MPIPVPVNLEPSAPVGEGLIAAAQSLPSNWQRGISFTDNNCLDPVVLGECPSGTDLKPAQRGEQAMFRPVSVVMAVECTTLSQYPVEEVSRSSLTRTRDFALARELLTGAASERDRNPNALDENQDPYMGNPSLQSEATDLGATFGTLAEALACIEQNLATATSGRTGGVIFAGADLITYLHAERLVYRSEGRWFTAAGSEVLVSVGFDGRAPGATSGPVSGDALYLYAALAFWAESGERAVYSDVNREDNTETSRAEDIALMAFPTCAVFAAASTAATAC